MKEKPKQKYTTQEASYFFIKQLIEMKEKHEDNIFK